MRIAIKTWLGYISLQPDGSLQFRDDVGEWETLDVVNLDPTPVPPPTPTIDPITGIWPPPEGTPRVRPPDVASVDQTEVTRELRWALWAADSSDDESYWLNTILLKPEPGHTPGWTNDDYWFLKIDAGDGAGRGYRWPPT